MPHKVAIGLLIVLTGVMGMSCAAKREKSPALDLSSPQSAAEYEAALREVVNRHVAHAGREEDMTRAPLIRRRPYYLKEFVLYPSDASEAQVTLQHRESRTRPYIADVKVEKRRYYTEPQKKRKAAQQDLQFYRDTGHETLTYEYRDNRWWRVGSLFVPEKSEEYINGEWLPRQEEVRVFVEPEDRGGFWLTRKFRQWFRRDKEE